jgi:hypothetical protein
MSSQSYLSVSVFILLWPKFVIHTGLAYCDIVNFITVDWGADSLTRNQSLIEASWTKARQSRASLS